MGSHDLDIENIIKTNESPESIFSLVEMLGEGSYGKVFKAQNKQNNKYYAVKIVSTVNQKLDELMKEISILKDCQNQNIVRYYGSYLYNEHLWLILEYCDIGSVYDLMKATQRTLNEVHIACILQGILQGLNYLHNNKKIHRDVKAGNILITKDGVCKLADFGVSAELNNTIGYIESFIGTPFWMSPEILSNKKYNKKTDIWSLGITAIEMAEGNPPNSQHKPYYAMLEIILRPPKGLSQPMMWSQEFNRFVNRCLTFDPEKRPDAEELLFDPFILKNTSIINPQEYLMDLALENMEYIRIFRKKLLKDQTQEKLDNKNNQQKLNDVKEQEKQLNNQNQIKPADKIEESVNISKEFDLIDEDILLNESGTITEFQNLEELNLEMESNQNLYKKHSIDQNDIYSQKINNLVWENETGTMVEKIETDDPLIQQINNQNNNLIKLFNQKNNYFSNIGNDQKKCNYPSQIYNETQNLIQEEQEDQENNSVIIKEDDEIEHIKGQAYSGVMLSESEQKPKQKVPNFVQFARQMEDNQSKKIPFIPTQINFQLDENQFQKKQIEEEMPVEYKNMNEQMIEDKIKSLKKELEMDIKLIQELYAFKVSQCEKALRIIKSKQNLSKFPNTPELNIMQNFQPAQNLSTNQEQNQQQMSPIKKSLQIQAEYKYELKTPAPKEQNFSHISNLVQFQSINNIQNQQSLSPFNKQHSYLLSQQNNEKIKKPSFESNNTILQQFSSVQTTNTKNQELISSIQQIEHHIDSQKLPSPQLQNLKYQKQIQYPLVSQNNIISVSQSPLTKNLTPNSKQYELNENKQNLLPYQSQSPYTAGKSPNYKEGQYDSVISYNSNLMNSSLNNPHLIPPKLQNKTFNEMQSSNHNLIHENINHIIDKNSDINLLKHQNPLLCDIYSEMPLPATPKPKENSYINHLAFGAQTQPAPSIIYSNCIKNSSSNINNYAQFTNGLVNLSSIKKQQDDSMHNIKNQFSKQNSKKESKDLMINQQQKQGLMNEEKYQRKASNHPINFLNSSKNFQQMFENSSMLNKYQNKAQINNINNKGDSNNLSQMLLTSDGGLSFEEILNRKNMLKQNKGQNIQTNNSHNIVYDENTIYKQQIQLQQQQLLQQQETNVKAQQMLSQINQLTQPSTPQKNSNILQQKSINNNNREFPIIPNKFQSSNIKQQKPNAIININKEQMNGTQYIRKQTEQYNQELSLFQSIQSQQYEQLKLRANLNLQQESQQNQQLIDNQQQDSYINQTCQYSNNYQKNNQTSKNQFNENSPSNGFMQKISDNYSSFNSSSIYNQQQYSPGYQQITQNMSRSQNQQNNISQGLQKVMKNNENNTNIEGNNSFLLNSQMMKNNNNNSNSFLSRKHSISDSIDEQKQYLLNNQKNNCGLLQKQNLSALKTEEQPNQINYLSQLQLQQIAQIKSSNNFANIISFKQLLNQQNERKIPHQNNFY